MDKQQIRAIVEENFPKEEEFNGQVTTITKIVDAFLNKEKRHVFLDAPTGSGKSVIAVGVAQTMNAIHGGLHKTSIVTSTRNLQTQYSDDFETISSLWGKRNYDCRFDTYYGSGECFIKRKENRCSNEVCPYFNAREEWMYSNLRMTNTSFQISASDIITNLPDTRANLIIIDECHTLGDKIQEHCTVKFEPAAFEPYRLILRSEINNINQVIKELLKIIEDNTVSGVTQLKESHKANLEKISEYFKYIYKSMNTKRDGLTLGNKDKALIYHHTECAFLASEYGGMAELLHLNIGQPMLNDDGKLRPVFPGSFAYYAVYRKANYFLHMSATICGFESYGKEVGIKNFEAVKVSNYIPKENRRIIFSPKQNVSKDALNSDMIKEIDQIIDDHKNQNGIIHTTSFRRADEVIKASKHAKNMSVLTGRDEIISLLSSKKGKIILSPSMVEGFDLKDDLARFQILLKVPYEDTTEPMTKLIFQKNKPLYFRRAVLKIVQACGRTTRHNDDYSETYLLDSAFYNLMKHNTDLFPEWFIEAIEVKK
jgi:hypothetical protein